MLLPMKVNTDTDVMASIGKCHSYWVLRKPQQTHALRLPADARPAATSPLRGFD